MFYLKSYFFLVNSILLMQARGVRIFDAADFSSSSCLKSMVVRHLGAQLTIANAVPSPEQWYF